MSESVTCGSKRVAKTLANLLRRVELNPDPRALPVMLFCVLFVVAARVLLFGCVVVRRLATVVQLSGPVDCAEVLGSALGRTVLLDCAAATKRRPAAARGPDAPGD